MTAEKNRTTNIMVVDDTIANLKLLEGILGRRGYRVRSFPRGRLALAAAAMEPPDLILLDINIPEMNGYEMCAKLKANPALAAIPVIFISALNEMLDKVKAFGCGGVDYINKPFQIEEILTRVDNHVTTRRLQVQLDQYQARFDESVRVKTQELANTNEQLLILDRAKNDFMRLISQELRTLPNGLANRTEQPAVSYLNDGNGHLMDAFQQSQQRWLRIMEDALLLTQTHAGTGCLAPALAPLSPLLRQAMDHAASHARQQNIVLPPVPDGLPPVSGNARLIQRALFAVLEMTLTFSQPGQTLEISCREEANEVLVVLTSSGHAVPENILAQILQVAAVPEGEPVSLVLAQRILSLFGGGLAVENQTPSGIRWTVKLKGVSPAKTAPKACA